jgi:hypothetical protein
MLGCCCDRLIPEMVEWLSTVGPPPVMVPRKAGKFWLGWWNLVSELLTSCWGRYILLIVAVLSKSVFPCSVSIMGDI